MINKIRIGGPSTTTSRALITCYRFKHCIKIPEHMPRQLIQPKVLPI